MLIGYGDKDNKCRRQVEVANMVDQYLPDLPDNSQETIFKMNSQFKELGHVKPLEGKPLINYNGKINILLGVQANLILSSHQVTQQCFEEPP